MAKRYAKISFLASGHVIQDVLITNPDITPDILTAMLKSGEAVTTVQEGKNVCATTGDWSPIAEVVYVEAELDYNDFILEDVYDLPKQPQEFNATRVALATAVGDIIAEPDKTIDEMLDILRHADGSEPPLTVTDTYSGMSGHQLLIEIDQSAKGYKSLMETAYNAAKLNQELV